MHRLLVHAEALEREVADLPRDAARHLKVLRPKPGEEIELFDGCGRTRRYRWNAARGVLENFREPDAQIGFLFARVTMGQMLTMPMLAVGIGIMLWSAKKA